MFTMTFICSHNALLSLFTHEVPLGTQCLQIVTLCTQCLHCIFVRSSFMDHAVPSCTKLYSSSGYDISQNTETDTKLYHNRDTKTGFDVVLPNQPAHPELNATNKLHSFASSDDRHKSALDSYAQSVAQ